MNSLPKCPACGSTLTYEDGAQYICPECAHEWPKDATPEAAEGPREVRDANGNLLVDGDTVTVIKDLKVKGSSTVLKRGTMIRNIHLTDDPDEIEGRTDKVKGLVLRTEFLKKA